MRKRWWAWPCTAVPPHSWIAAAEAHSSVWGGGRTSKRQTRKNNGGKHKWERSLCLLWGSAVVSLCVNLLEVIQFWFPTDLFYDLAKGSCSSLLDSVGEGEGCLQCMRHRFDPWVGKIPWRRNWQPTPVFLPGEFLGQRNLVGYSP